MVNVSLALLVGLPASGKSTFCDRLVSRTEKSHGKYNISVPNCHYIHVCFDSLLSLDEQEILAKAAIEEGLTGIMKDARENIFKKVESLLEVLLTFEICSQNLLDELLRLEFRSSLSLNSPLINVVILLDDNFYYRSMRYQYYLLAFKHKTGFCQAYFDCPLDEAVQRNSVRSPKVPDSVIRQISEKLQPPSANNSWEKLSFTVAAHGKISEAIKSFEDTAFNSLKSPVDTFDCEVERLAKTEMALQSKVVCSKSVVHQSDILLRQIVKDVLLQYAGQESKVSKNISLAKRNVLTLLKKGNIDLPSCFQEEFSEDSRSLIRVNLQEIFVKEFNVLMSSK